MLVLVMRVVHFLIGSSCWTGVPSLRDSISIMTCSVDLDPSVVDGSRT
eukprot:COSAG06_NODE_2628_length_6556_cov_4.840948_4_plen_48_part_00